jgi:hypothetical protein
VIEDMRRSFLVTSIVAAVILASFVDSMDVSAQITSDEVQDKVFACVVKIVTPSGLGMGTFIDKQGRILTLASVLGTHNQRDIQVQLRDGSYAEVQSIDKMEQFSTVGLAIVKCKVQPYQQWLGISAEPLKNLSELVSVGYLGRVDYSIVSGKVSRVANGKVFVNMNLGNGSYGAPLLDRDGFVVGIVKDIVNQGNYLVTGLTTLAVTDILDRVKTVRYTVKPPSYVPIDPTGGTDGKAFDPVVTELEGKLSNCESENTNLSNRLALAERVIVSVRDSAGRAIRSETARVEQERRQLADDRRAHERKVQESRDLYDSVEASKQRLRNVRSDIVTSSEQLGLLQTKIDGLQYQRDQLSQEKRELEQTVAVLDRRKEALEETTILPRMRFDARAHGLLQSLRYGRELTMHTALRGEAAIGVRLGVKSKQDVGDMIGVYIAGNSIRRSESSQVVSAQSLDWGGVVDFNNTVRLQVGVGSSNQTDIPNLIDYTITSVSLKFSGTTGAAWGISAQAMKSVDDPTFHIGGGVWFSFGSNFLQL